MNIPIIFEQQGGDAAKQAINGVQQALSQMGPYGQAAAAALGLITSAINDVMSATRMLTNVVDEVIKIGGAFEGVSTTLASLTKNADPKAYDDMMGTIKELGKSTTYTTTQIAQGAVELVKAGRSAGDVTKELNGVVSAAQANGLKLSETANMGAVGVNIFKKSGESIADIFEIVTSAANQSSVDFKEVYRSMVRVGPIASQLGSNVTEVSTALAILGNAGVTGADAGHKLKNAFQTLIKPAGDSKKVINEYGLEFKDASGKMKDFPAILDELQTKLMSTGDQTKFTADMFRLFKGGATVMLPLVEGGAAAFQNMSDKITNARSSMSEMQKMKADTMAMSIEGLNGSIEAVYLSLMELLKLPITTYYQEMMNIVNTVVGRLETLGAAFSKQYAVIRKGLGKPDDAMTDVKAWGQTLQKMDWKGLFGGLIQDIKPFTDVLVELFMQAWAAIKTVTNEFFKTDLLPMFMEVAVNVGGKFGGAFVEAIGLAIKAKFTVVATAIGELIGALMENPILKAILVGSGLSLLSGAGAKKTVETFVPSTTRDTEDAKLQDYANTSKMRKAFGARLGVDLGAVDQKMDVGRMQAVNLLDKKQLAALTPEQKEKLVNISTSRQEVDAILKSISEESLAQAQRATDIENTLKTLATARGVALSPEKLAADAERVKTGKGFTEQQAGRIQDLTRFGGYDQDYARALVIDQEADLKKFQEGEAKAAMIKQGAKQKEYDENYYKAQAEKTGKQTDIIRQFHERQITNLMEATGVSEEEARVVYDQQRKDMKEKVDLTGWGKETGLLDKKTGAMAVKFTSPAGNMRAQQLNAGFAQREQELALQQALGIVDEETIAKQQKMLAGRKTGATQQLLEGLLPTTRKASDRRDLEKSLASTYLYQAANIDEAKATEYDQMRKTLRGEGKTPEEIEKALAKQKESDITTAQAQAQRWFAKSGVSEAAAQKEERRVGLRSAEMAEGKQTLAVSDAEKQIADQGAKVKNIWLETQDAIAAAGKDFAKWLLEPVDMFKQAALHVKQQFGDLIGGLEGKQLNIWERLQKAGVKVEGAPKDDKEMAAAKAELTKKAGGRLEEQLKLAQTAGEKQSILEKLAENATKQAEEGLTPGDKQAAGDKAADYIKKSLAEAEKAQQVELKKVKLDKEFTEESTMRLQGMLANATGKPGEAGATPGYQAEIMERLLKNLQSLGDVEGADKMQKSLEKAQLAATKEKEEREKAQLELAKQQLEIDKEMLAELQAQTKEARQAVKAPYLPEIQKF